MAANVANVNELPCKRFAMYSLIWTSREEGIFCSGQVNVLSSLPLPLAPVPSSPAHFHAWALPVPSVFLLHLCSQTITHLFRISFIQTNNQGTRFSVLQQAKWKKECQRNSSDPWARLLHRQPMLSSSSSYLRSGSKFQAHSSAAARTALTPGAPHLVCSEAHRAEVQEPGWMPESSVLPFINTYVWTFSAELWNKTCQDRGGSSILYTKPTRELAHLILMRANI